ncbi:MAG TPA: PIN domain nuclease [Actinoplanes sp.]|nr:PIN domain nuclease [Actinoplanes sp.]
MKATGYLVDTSAVARLSRQPKLREVWREQIGAGRLAICSITELEILFSARSPAHRDELRSVLREAYGWVASPDRVFERSLDVQAALTDRGTHRSAGPVDLLVAATAEAHGLTLLHYDADFTTIAEVTGQPARWVAEPGTID